MKKAWCHVEDTFSVLGYECCARFLVVNNIDTNSLEHYPLHVGRAVDVNIYTKILNAKEYIPFLSEKVAST